MRAQKIKFIFSGSFTKIQKKILVFFFFFSKSYLLKAIENWFICVRACAAKAYIANIISRRLKRIGRRHRAQVALNGIFKSVLKQIYLLQRVVATAEQQSMRYLCCQKVNNRVSSREQPLVILLAHARGQNVGGRTKENVTHFFCCCYLKNKYASEFSFSAA